MPQVLFALLLTMTTDATTFREMGPDQNWLHGRWLHVAVSHTAPDMPPEQPRIPKAKHLLLFRPDGELRRYSPQKGWDRLLLDFEIHQETVTLHPHTGQTPAIKAQKTGEGLLQVCMPNRGTFYYQKIGPTTQLTEIDFAMPPSDKSKPDAKSGE